MKKVLILCAGILLCGVACKDARKASAAKPTAPAKVITEESLSSITLTPEAEIRLGVVTVPVTSQVVARTRQVSGDLLLPLATPGQGTNRSKSIYSLLPNLTSSEMVRLAEMQIEADGKIASAEVDINTAKLNLERAVNLVASKAGPQRSVDDLRAQVQHAEVALRTARERRALLGAPLFEAVRRDVLWVRAPVYAGDIEGIDRKSPAQISQLSFHTNQTSFVGRPVEVPITQSTGFTSFDLFYEIENKNGSLRPGQKVTVSIPLRATAESLVVPKAAVLYDMHGGEWVYENTAPHTFARRRIQIRFSNATNMVLARGPKVGAKIVTDGAAEIFGTEFGIGK